MIEKMDNLTNIFNLDKTTSALLLTIIAIIILLLPLIAHHIYKSRKRKEVLPFVIKDEENEETD